MKKQTVSVIFGPPGTGKTNRLIEEARVYRIVNGKILFLAFTRAAATEINSRMSGEPASTIHSFCYRQLGLTNAQVVDKVKLQEFSRAVNVPIAGGGIQDMAQLEGDIYLSIMSYADNRLMPLPEAYDALGRPGSPARFEMFCNAYEQWKKTYGYVDFDDMLDRWFNSNMQPPAYDAVFLDEAQDLTRAQWVVFHKIIERTPHIVIAGDDDQAIFQWMGAIPEGMTDFACRMNWGDDVEMEILEQSYRVPRRMHGLANRVIEEIDGRVRKTYNPRDAEGKLVYYMSPSSIINDLNSTGRDAMWLFRDRFKMLDAQYHLNDAMVPYSVVGGFSPWTSRYADMARRGEYKDIPARHWRFYDGTIESGALSQPVELELSTVHKAKGREHDRVIFSVEGSGRALENMYEDPAAEIRVLYVGITRAKEELWLHGHHLSLA